MQIVTEGRLILNTYGAYEGFSKHAFVHIFL